MVASATFGTPLLSTPPSNVSTSSGRPSADCFDVGPAMRNGKRVAFCFDMHGHMVPKEVTRAEVLKLVAGATDPAHEPNVPALHMRDLRKLDAVFTVSNEPSLSVRHQAILLNADPLRAVILRDTCLVFLPSGAESLASMLETLVQEHTKAPHSLDRTTPFELRALEAVLATICAVLVMDGDALLPCANAAVERMSRLDLPMGDMDTLRALKNSLHELSSRVGAVRRMLLGALDKEDDLRLMQLTALGNSAVHETVATETVEAIIEAYLHDMYATQTRVALMLQRVQSTEAMVLLQLQTKRNSLLVVDLTLNMVATLVAVPNFLVGGFGMNLDSTLETVPYLFWVVFGVCIAFPILAFHVMSLYLSHRGIFLRWDAM